MARRRQNERAVERWVEDHFAADPFPDLLCEQQGSRADEDVDRLLAKAGKAGRGGRGRPEHVVHSPEKPGFLVVVECKSDPQHHVSPDPVRAPSPVDYAVDGALHYARHLSPDYDVIAIGVSGETDAERRVTAYRWLKGQAAPEELVTPGGSHITSLLSFGEYAHLRDFDPRVRRRTYDELMAYSRELHNFLRDYAGVSEAEKPLLVSGALIALQDDGFGKQYRLLQPAHLPGNLVAAVKRQLEEADIPESKLRFMRQPYSFIETHPELAKVPKGKKKTPLQTIVEGLDREVMPLIKTYHDFDIVGQFYGEFLRYHGGDKKGLGIVLTPMHTTDLMARLIEVGPRDTVLDICAGTAGFLIAAMARMDQQAGGDPAVKARIRSKGLIGVELRPEMYAMATANMLLRGDGKSNFFQGSCFDESITADLLSPPRDRNGNPRFDRATKGLLNPPFSQKGEGLKELNFVKHLLDCLQPGGLAAVIVPVQCALGYPELKRQILTEHTLEAVMTMPGELFYPVGTHTCIMVFRAGQAHDPTRRSWFGSWKDDGFVKTKQFGRIDLHHRWDDIRDEWLDAFRDRRVEPGKSVMQAVNHEMEWVAEAYMETDYSALTEQDFNAAVRDFVLFCIGADGEEAETSADVEA